MNLEAIVDLLTDYLPIIAAVIASLIAAVEHYKKGDYRDALKSTVIAIECITNEEARNEAKDSAYSCACKFGVNDSSLHPIVEEVEKELKYPENHS